MSPFLFEKPCASYASACHRFRFSRARLIAVLAAGLPFLTSLAADSDPVAGVRKSASDWVTTRMETTRIETEWRTQRQLLESTVEGLAERAQTLEEKREFLQAKTAKDREELAALTSLTTSSTAALQSLEGRVKELSLRLIRIRPSLPPRLSTALELPYRSLADSALSISERMQLNMSVLNRCTQFNRSVTCEEEVLNLDADKNAQVLEVVYWGLSHGYALDRAAGKAWLGTPGPEGWKWEPRPEAAASIAELVAIYHDKADPSFVTVPVKLSHPAGETAK